MSEHHHKEIKLIHSCPKCGNTEGLMVIPGSGMKFYYCPACYKDKALVTAEEKSIANS